MERASRPESQEVTMDSLPGAVAGEQRELPEALRKFLVDGCEGGEGMTTVMDECVLGLDLGLELQRLHSETWAPGNLIIDCLEAEKTSDVEVSPWLTPPRDRVAATRRVDGRVPVAMLPRAAPRVTFMYRVTTEDVSGAKVIRVARSTKAEVPFGDCFSVEELITLAPCAAGAAVTKSFRVVFEKSTVIRALIVSNTAGEQQRTASLLLEVLRRHASAAALPASLPAGAARAPAALERALEVWELRRCGEGCCLPFLQACGNCWLDMDYQRCALDSSSKASQRPGPPPVVLPCGWRLSTEGWRVAGAPGETDLEGWQYALGFCRSDRFWGAKASGRRWQRRRWRCKLVKDSESPAALRGASAAAAGHPHKQSTSAVARKPPRGKPWPLESSITVLLLVCFIAAALHPGSAGAGFAALSANEAQALVHGVR